jgi:hypothetical protein
MMSSPANLPSGGNASGASSKKKAKRGRSPSAGSSNTSCLLSTAQPHALFRLQDDPDSDIILHSSDNQLFWFPKFYLQASSQVRPLLRDLPCFLLSFRRDYSYTADPLMLSSRTRAILLIG